MDKFRRDIHGVFARQQSGLGNSAGASDRLLRQALVPPQVRRHFVPQLAAALATLLVGAAIAYTVVIMRGHLHSQNPVTHLTPSATPKASATPVAAPTALALPLDVPPSTPVIIYFDPVNPEQADGVTWDGSRHGRIGGFGGQVFGLIQNPAGTLYSTFQDIRDRRGQVVAPVVRNSKPFGLWSDDGRQYCQVVSASSLPPAGGEPATLRLVTLEGRVHNVAQVGTMYQQSGAGIAACSVEGDRAVVTQSTSIGTTLKFWVVQLSTGRILWSGAPAGASGNGSLGISRDGQFVAENGSPGTSSTIYGPTGAVVGHVAGTVEGFSWDGTLAVVAQDGGATSVVRWRDGTVVWSAPAGTLFSDMLPEAGGSKVAVAVQTPGHPQTGGFPIVDVYAVSPDGTALQILANVSL